MKCPSCKHDVRRDHNGNGCKRLDECSCRSTQNELLLMGSAKMPKAHRDRDLIIRVGIGIAGGIIVVIVGLHFLEQVKGNAQAQAGVLAGIITFLGGVFAAAYKEISSYYQEKSINLQKRWDNIFPYIEKYYNPWINSARILKEGIVLLLDDKKKVEIDRLLYNLLLFYGYRLRLVINAGAIILLPSVEDERMVLLKYLNVMRTINWAGDETYERLSDLQYRFITKYTIDKPYVMHQFTKDLSFDGYLSESRSQLDSWAKDNNNLMKAKQSLDDFINTFERNISELYKVWG